MFNNLNNHNNDNSWERLDFKFSNFQLLQVPKGYDKLFVSIISVETGKTISKSGKASVRNGQCQWEDSLLSSIWISQDSFFENDDYLLKLVVAMGSARFGTLGEATVNVVNYTSSEASIPLSLPLKNSYDGMILQVKIKFLSPKTILRDETTKDADSCLEEMNVDYDDIENKSDVSEITFTRSVVFVL
ncbi:putative Myosin heavy chain-like protein [Quillaja saponaria]|uniref:Myosin heavy chain-like protein n=1 Tax=Quillaja saponaria TaxID=32244 RepID=A0AAD7VGP4_QUISA|nr:putative Myosin heavy chain-like protein [Quillaja saponaria]